MNGQERLSPMHEVLGLAHRFGQHIWDGLGERLSTGFGGRAGLLFPVLDGDGVSRGSHNAGCPSASELPSGVDDVRAPIIHSNPRIVS